MLQHFLTSIVLNGGFKITHEPFRLFQFGVQKDVNLRIGLNLLNELGEVLLNILTPPRLIYVSGLAPEGLAFFDQIGVDTLRCQVLAAIIPEIPPPMTRAFWLILIVGSEKVGRGPLWRWPSGPSPWPFPFPPPYHHYAPTNIGCGCSPSQRGIC